VSIIPPSQLLSAIDHLRGEDGKQSEAAGQDRARNIMNIPELCIYTENGECVMSEFMEEFSDRFKKIDDYRVANVPNKNDGSCFVYNPQMIVRVAPLTSKQRIEVMI
jgi:hypothetical protein